MIKLSLCIVFFMTFQMILAQDIREKINNNDLVVAIYTQDGAEVLDMAAPLEILSHAGFEIYTVGLKKEKITSQSTLTMIPNHDLASAPPADILIFVGGNADASSDNKKVKNWLLAKAPSAQKVMSICTGVFFLAKAGLLDGKNATTFHHSLDYLEEDFPRVKVHRDQRVIEDGKFISTAGISAGIDGSLHLIASTLGAEVAQAVAKHIEYEAWHPEKVMVVAPESDD